MKRRITHNRLIQRATDIINCLCGERPPDQLVALLWDGGDTTQLQDWIGNTSGIASSYATSLSIMDAAQDIAESQILNGYEEL
jgi:hypothetical protein